MNNETKVEQQELAMLQFSREEVKTITGADVDEESYMRGRLMAQAEVRRAILVEAKKGSSPAQKQFQDLIWESK